MPRSIDSDRMWLDPDTRRRALGESGVDMGASSPVSAPPEVSASRGLLVGRPQRSDDAGGSPCLGRGRASKGLIVPLAGRGGRVRDKWRRSAIALCDSTL